MSGYLSKRIATVTVVLAGCLSASVAFAATPAALSTGNGQAPGNSRQSSAVLEASNIAPGESRSATVTITNKDGGKPATFSLTKYGLREQPGRGGGRLSAQLDLRLEDVTDQPSSTTLYRGPLGAMAGQTLGTYMPGESRKYRFTVTFTDRRAALGADLADNAYMGSSLSLEFRWRSSQ